MTIAASNSYQPAEPDSQGWAAVETLVARRKELGLTQGDVARRMHVGQPSVCMFEKGHMEPRLSTLMRYAQAVGASVSLEIVEHSED